MRLQKRNLRQIYYCQCLGETDILDDDGQYTGMKSVSYADAVAMMVSISVPYGESRPMEFGSIEPYQYTVYTDDMDCPIDEHSVLFIDKEPPEHGAEGYNYSVLQVAKSINSIAYKVSKVK